ncbi:MAG: N-6 DNA methylase [Anaerolineae bacterium]
MGSMVATTPDNGPRIDEAFNLLQAALPTGLLTAADTFAVPSAPGVSAPVQGLVVAAGGTPLAVIGLVPPSIAADAPALLEFLALKARAQRAPYLVACNLRDAALRGTPRIGVPATSVEPLRRYPTLFDITPATGSPLAPLVRIAVQQRAEEIFRDLATLHRDGRLDLIVPDATFFVHRLTSAVEVLKPHLKEALRFELRHKPQFAHELERWAIGQGIPANLRSDDFLEAITRQAIYRLLGKVIFYQSLRRSVRSLPELSLTGVDSSYVMPRLRAAFAEALKVDYHAVFAEVLIDRLPYPQAAATELAALIEDLNTRDFASLPQDVVGQVFEQLIPREERHGLGQFFTPEPLADLICAFCVRRADDHVLDPTAGTGTFLIRAYDRLRWMGVQEHTKLLSQLWGVDIAPFPAELATINLFRQRVDEHGNFPRILCQDFFQLQPGQTCRFPPLKADDERPDFVDEPVPIFDALVGNFPYISNNQIEKQEAGYLDTIRRVVAEGWFLDAPEMFTIADRRLQADYERQRKVGNDLSAFISHARPDISTYADLYVYLFFHAAHFLRPGGKMGIVTSNAWLDVNYGYALQRFFLGHFKIVAILESRCEPWFKDAAVNTVVTILERCDSETERDAHAVKFVKVKCRLEELVPEDMRLEALARWQRLNGLVQRIEATISPLPDLGEGSGVREDPDLRIRAVRQSALRAQVEAAGQTVKWGPYLRAPDVYFDLLRQAGDRLALLREVAPPTRGSETGINEFFHFDDAKAKQWNIEPEFLFPLLKSPSESAYIPIDEGDLRLKVFVCRLTKDELRTQGKKRALRYIEWGEQQVFTSGVQAGLTWPQGASVRNRKPGWYALPEYHSRPAQLFVSKGYGDRHLLRVSPQPLIADCRLYFLDPVPEIDAGLLAAVMNSSLVAFLLELAGRVILGDGALDVMVEEFRDYLLVPDVRQFDTAARQAIIAAFQPLLKRPIGSVFEEVKRKDRQALDRAVLQAMGLDPAAWLPRIYDGLTALVHERIELGRMRNKARKSKVSRAANKVAEEVLADVLPDGPRRFPDDFWSPAARQGEFTEVTLPQAPLRYAGHMFGREEVVAEGGFHYQARSKHEAKYLIYAQAAGQEVARLPAQPVELSRTVANYEQYVRQTRDALYEAYYRRTLDQKAASRFVNSAMQRLTLVLVEDGE